MQTLLTEVETLQFGYMEAFNNPFLGDLYGSNYEKTLLLIARRFSSQENRIKGILRRYLKQIESEWARVHEPSKEALRRVHNALLKQLEDLEKNLSTDLVKELKEMARLGIKLGSRPFDVPALQDLMVDIGIPSFDLPRFLAAVSPELVEGTAVSLIKGVTDVARARIGSVVTQTMIGALSPTDAIKQIGENLEDPSIFRDIFTRSEVIYRTETGRLLNMGLAWSSQLTASALKKAGVRMLKTWLTANDERVRPSHQALHGQTVDLEKPFFVGGFKAFGPHDPNLPAKEAINCRCTLYIQPNWADVEKQAVEKKKQVVKKAIKRRKFWMRTDFVRAMNSAPKVKKVWESGDELVNSLHSTFSKHFDMQIKATPRFQKWNGVRAGGAHAFTCGIKLPKSTLEAWKWARKHPGKEIWDREKSFKVLASVHEWLHSFQTIDLTSFYQDIVPIEAFNDLLTYATVPAVVKAYAGEIAPRIAVNDIYSIITLTFAEIFESAYGKDWLKYVVKIHPKSGDEMWKELGKALNLFCKKKGVKYALKDFKSKIKEAAGYMRASAYASYENVINEIREKLGLDVVDGFLHVDLYMSDKEIRFVWQWGTQKLKEIVITE